MRIVCERLRQMQRWEDFYLDELCPLRKKKEKRRKRKKENERERNRKDYTRRDNINNIT